ncbi:MAG TPA: asparagine synthase-related protein [Verrucomicrobiae bacterium]|jgi:asparagine synthase (glutamine-hydrolysing)
MPGILGIISQSPAEQSSRRIAAMVGAMTHEDFYKSQTCSVSEMGTHAAFVGFKDSTDGIYSHQGGTTVLVFSGECFVGTALANGEILTRMYEQEGEGMLEKLNGLFCGVLIDKDRKKVLLFNDRYGMRRIYFHESDGNFYFASEAKALLRILPELREFDPEGVADYLTFGSTLDWRTLFRGIEIVPGGSVWTFEGGRCHRGKYFSPEMWESRSELGTDEYEKLLPETFRRILPRYFESDSRTGIALTGGLDTRMIMACRPQNNGHTTCYTFSGNNGQTQDDKIAARVAAASNLEHSLLRLEPDFFSKFPEHVDKTVFATDGCAGVCNAHETYFNRKAREFAPVRLTGNYGSEILRGISTFKPLYLSPQLLRPNWRPIIQSRPGRLSAGKSHPMTFAAFKEIPWNLYGNLSAGWSQLQFRTPYLDNELVALAFQAPAPSRNSSMPSLRVVSANNAALCEIPTDRGFANANSGLGFLSRRLFAEVTFKLDYYNNEGFPRALAPFEPLLKSASTRLGFVGLHKFLHYRSWLQNEFGPYVRETVAAAKHRLDNFFDPRFLELMAAEHIEKRRNHSLEINAVLTLAAVERLLFRDLPRD